MNRIFAVLLLVCFCMNGITVIHASRKVNSSPGLQKHPELRSLEKKIHDILRSKNGDDRENQLFRAIDNKITYSDYKKYIELLKLDAEEIGKKMFGTIKPAEEAGKIKPTSVEWIFQRGQTVNGYAHGLAVGKSADGARTIIGKFSSGTLTEGVYEAKKWKEIGTWDEKGLTGQGAYLDENNNFFIGEFKNGELNGYGVSGNLKNEQIYYVGSWKNYQWNGEGIMISGGVELKSANSLTDDHPYLALGNWVLGKRSGDFAETDGDKSVFVGKYKDDKKEGFGSIEIITDKDSNWYRYGNFKDGKKEGMFTLRKSHEPDSWKYSEFYVNDKYTDDISALGVGNYTEKTSASVIKINTDTAGNNSYKQPEKVKSSGIQRIVLSDPKSENKDSGSEKEISASEKILLEQQAELERIKAEKELLEKQKEIEKMQIEQKLIAQQNELERIKIQQQLIERQKELERIQQEKLNAQKQKQVEIKKDEKAAEAQKIEGVWIRNDGLEIVISDISSQTGGKAFWNKENDFWKKHLNEHYINSKISSMKIKDIVYSGNNEWLGKELWFSYQKGKMTTVWKDCIISINPNNELRVGYRMYAQKKDEN